MTFEMMARRVHERKFGDRVNNEKHIAQWIRTLETFAFPKIGKMSVEEIRQDDIEYILNPIWTEKAETTRRVLRMIQRRHSQTAGAAGPERCLRPKAQGEWTAAGGHSLVVTKSYKHPLGKYRYLNQ